MTIRVIQAGIKPETIEYKGRCLNCSSIISATRADGTYISSQRDGTFVQFPCPVCGRSMTIDISERNKVSSSAEEYYKK